MRPLPNLKPLTLAVHLALGGALTLGISSQVQAQSDAPAIEYEIPAGPLSEALSRFAQQSGVAIAMDAAQLKGLNTPGLRGSYGVEEGFGILLRDSGYSVARTASGFVLRPAAATTAAPPATSAASATPKTMAAVRVTEDSASDSPSDAYAGGQVARGASLGLLGQRDFLDTPFNLTSYTSDLMQNQQARSLADVVLHDPSVRYSGTRTQDWDYFSIRGFGQGNSDAMLEGIYGITSSHQVGTESLERVEVMKGPNALLHGMAPNGAIGGVLNLVPKRAGVDPLAQFTATYYSDSQFGGHLDIGRRFGDDQNVGLRFNGVYRDGEASIANNDQEVANATVALDYQGEKFRLTLDAGYQSRDNQGLDSDSYLAEGATLPAPPRADATYLQPWTRSDSESTYGVLRGEYAISPSISVFAAGGLARDDSEMVLSYASELQSNGDFIENFWGSASYKKTSTAEAGMSAVFETGAVRHQLVFKASTLKIEEGGLYYFDGSIDGSLTTPFDANPSNIYDPNYVAAPVLGGFPGVPKATETTLSGLALADTLTFADERVLLTLGARLQKVQADNFDAVSGERQVPGYDEDEVTPALGLVVKPSEMFSVYTNYIEGLSPGTTAPSNAANAGEVFPPFRSKQIEGGVKFDFGKLGFSSSLFQIERPSTVIDPVSMVFSLNGEQRNRGLEFDVFGELTASTRLLGGIMLIDPELVKTQDGTFDGREAPGTPKLNANLAFEWDASFLPGLTFRVLGVHTGRSYVDSGNTQELPSWSRLDVGVRHAFSIADRPWVVRFNVENLFDEKYWNDEYLYRGAPRTILLSVTADLSP